MGVSVSHKAKIVYQNTAVTQHDCTKKPACPLKKRWPSSILSADLETRQITF